MLRFAQTAAAIAATTKKLEKTALVAGYLQSLPIQDAATAAIFLSGRPFPVHEETTLNAGGALLWRIVGELSGKTDSQLTASYRTHGDLGAVAEEVLPTRPDVPPLTLSDVEQTFRRIAAARGPAAKAAIVRDLLLRASPSEARYLIKIITGDLRIGLKESLVEEAIAKAFGATAAEVQRANMLMGDIGQTLRLAAEHRQADARMRLFHPIGFMLASPAQSAEEALSYFDQAAVEDKYDGIRAQAHCARNQVRIFSRTRDDITESFPELPDALAGFPHDVILDGEIVAWSYLADGAAGPEERQQQDEQESEKAEAVRKAPAEPRLAPNQAANEEENLTGDSSTPPSYAGRALPFTALQQRLGRKKVGAALMHRVPVAYLVFDILYAAGELTIDRPLHQRARMLDGLLAQLAAGARARSSRRQEELAFAPADLGDLPCARIIRAPVWTASTPERLDQLFTAAQARGNEGLMIKDLNSLYTPGRRGKSWLKMKRELATLDVVVTAAEYGHGKRIGVLSDYTFAVRDGERLVNVGKAYSGLTDVEIAEMTKWFLDHTLEDQGFRRAVEPQVVLEVAFNNVMISSRHNSGYALRFPRIARIRRDKPPEEIDTLARVQEIYESQNKSG